jgi:hypothetical protein
VLLANRIRSDIPPVLTISDAAAHGRQTGSGCQACPGGVARGSDDYDGIRASLYSWVMPTKSDHGEIGDVEPLADSTASQARRVVAAYANDADECRIFLSMLGIGPAKHET